MTFGAYDPRRWFWIIGDDTTRAWSSEVKTYVNSWAADRVSRIKNEIELYDVLARMGLRRLAPRCDFSASEIRDALVHIDAAAVGASSDMDALRGIAEAMGLLLPPFPGPT
jgi:hypothetical protein